jgi:PRTRC genetic system protein C
MSLTVAPLKRIFRFATLTLPDPGPHMTPQAVRQFYAGQHPGLNTANIEGPVTMSDGALQYDFVASVRDKG